ncbi:MAG: 30S ribosomal protein S17 [Candidatus Nanoarchaeia archaeon]
MTETKKVLKKKMEDKKLAGASITEKIDCIDKKCHIHGNLSIRGKTFEGKVIRKFPKRVTIEFERMIYIRKYERYAKTKTKIHARLQDCMVDEIKIGDFIRIQECRPLSKIIHFIVIKKVRSKEDRKVK